MGERTMDGLQFDAIAKELATGRASRRRTLRLLAAAAGGLVPLLGRRPVAAACGRVGAACAGDADCCNGARCANNGTCRCRAGGTDCGDGRCVNLQTNRNNCGECDIACRADQICAEGACACPDGRRDCLGRCCPAGTSCIGVGVCCPTARTCAGRFCCRADQECRLGFCRCPAGTADCGGACRSTVCPPGRVFQRCRCCRVEDKTCETTADCCDGLSCLPDRRNVKTCRPTPAPGSLEPGDGCDPDNPSLCRFGVCGCAGSARICTCRLPNCKAAGGDCSRGLNNACCEGICALDGNDNLVCFAA